MAFVSRVSATKQQQHGLTSPAAEFRYFPGEVIRFYIGETVVAELPAQERLTLLDLAGANELRWDNRSLRFAARRFDPRLERLRELAVLFASLDDDGNPENGVLLTRGLRALTADRDFGFVTNDYATLQRWSWRTIPEGDPYRVMMEAQSVFHGRIEWCPPRLPLMRFFENWISTSLWMLGWGRVLRG